MFPDWFFPLQKLEDTTPEKAMELFEFICSEEAKGYRPACHLLRLRIAYTAEVIDKDGCIVNNHLKGNIDGTSAKYTAA